MVVTNLEQAESIVKNNPMLEWNGWDIVHVRHNKAAWMNKNGMYRNGKWYLRTTMTPDRNGWDIPNKYVR